MHTFYTFKAGLLTIALLAAGAATAVQAAPVGVIPVKGNGGFSIQRPSVNTTQAHHWFAAVPMTIRQADSGISLGGGFMHQKYTETMNGNTLDSEGGTLQTINVGGGSQYSHIGFHTGLEYAGGHDTYKGALQKCTAMGCMTTPETSRTENAILDFITMIDYGFSPMAHLAVFPEAMLGAHYWRRAIADPGAVTEDYYNGYYACGLKMQYVVGPVVLGVEGRYGHTFLSRVDIEQIGTTLHLGNAPIYSVGFRTTWVARPWLKVYAGVTYGVFSYGASKVETVQNFLLVQEPRSRTQQNFVDFGITIF